MPDHWMMLPLLCLDFQIRIWNGSFVFYCPFLNDFQYVFRHFQQDINRVAKTHGRCRLCSFVWNKQSNYFEAYATISKVRKNKRANFFFSSSFPLLLLWRLASSKCTHHTSTSVLFSFLLLLYCYYCLITFPSCKTKNLEVRSSSKDA